MSGCRTTELGALRRRRSGRSAAVLAAFAATFAVSACGGQRQDVAEPLGRFMVSIPTATFPAAQRMSEHTHMVIVVRNAGHKTIPNVAVTVCNVTCRFPAPAGEGTSARPFGENLTQPYVADPTRPVWIVDRPPGGCAYNCYAGGPGTSYTAYANTWSLGPVAPGHTATFDWQLTAVAPGRHVVAWEVAAGLNGKAQAVLSDGTLPQGTFTVSISNRPSTALQSCSWNVDQKSCQTLPNSAP